MDRKRLQETREWVRKELASSAEFWLKYGMDKEHGGVYTCIDRTGRLFSTDKSVWMQGRCGWTYAYLCTVYGTRPEWLEASKSCLDFMEKHCINREADGRMYFTVTGDGKPTEPACKGCTFKGPFHVPRSLIMADQLIGQILEQN